MWKAHLIPWLLYRLVWTSAPLSYAVHTNTGGFVRVMHWWCTGCSHLSQQAVAKNNFDQLWWHLDLPQKPDLTFKDIRFPVSQKGEWVKPFLPENWYCNKHCLYEVSTVKPVLSIWFRDRLKGSLNAGSCLIQANLGRFYFSKYRHRALGIKTSFWSSSSSQLCIFQCVCWSWFKDKWEFLHVFMSWQFPICCKLYMYIVCSPNFCGHQGYFTLFTGSLTSRTGDGLLMQQKTVFDRLLIVCMYKLHLVTAICHCLVLVNNYII